MAVESSGNTCEAATQRLICPRLSMLGHVPGVKRIVPPNPVLPAGGSSPLSQALNTVTKATMRTHSIR
jgi:hypothetical protein